jgi:hypothetical protein
MDYAEVLDRVISAAVWWFCTDTKQHELGKALDIVIRQADRDDSDTAHQRALIAAWMRTDSGGARQ